VCGQTCTFKSRGKFPVPAGTPTNGGLSRNIIVPQGGGPPQLGTLTVCVELEQHYVSTLIIGIRKDGADCTLLGPEGYRPGRETPVNGVLCWSSAPPDPNLRVGDAFIRQPVLSIKPATYSPDGGECLKAFATQGVLAQGTWNVYMSDFELSENSKIKSATITFLGCNSTTEKGAAQHGRGV
jgi:hypothetical protein